jgi:hypothetical protein
VLPAQRRSGSENSFCAESIAGESLPIRLASKTYSSVEAFTIVLVCRRPDVEQSILQKYLDFPLPRAADLSAARLRAVAVVCNQPLDTVGFIVKPVNQDGRSAFDSGSV